MAAAAVATSAAGGRDGDFRSGTPGYDSVCGFGHDLQAQFVRVQVEVQTTTRRVGEHLHPSSLGSAEHTGSHGALWIWPCRFGWGSGLLSWAGSHAETGEHLVDLHFGACGVGCGEARGHVQPVPVRHDGVEHDDGVDLPGCADGGALFGC